MVFELCIYDPILYLIFILNKKYKIISNFTLYDF